MGTGEGCGGGGKGDETPGGGVKINTFSYGSTFYLIICHPKKGASI